MANLPNTKNPALVLKWVKSTEQSWLSFQRVNLENVTTQGVYVIWHGGNPARTVYVGQGDVAARIKAHRDRREIMAYRERGLYVTWAAVSAAHRDAVERYLADRLAPLVGDAHPDVEPIAVNSPWG